MRNYNHALLIPFKQVMETGREMDRKDPGLFDRS